MRVSWMKLEICRKKERKFLITCRGTVFLFSSHFSPSCSFLCTPTRTRDWSFFPLATLFSLRWMEEKEDAAVNVKERELLLCHQNYDTFVMLPFFTLAILLLSFPLFLMKWNFNLVTWSHSNSKEAVMVVIFILEMIHTLRGHHNFHA